MLTASGSSASRAACCARVAAGSSSRRWPKRGSCARWRPRRRSACSKARSPSTVDALVELDARPVLNTLEQVERWRGKGRALLHLDTGMNRLGLSSCRRRCARCSAQDLLDELALDFVMTHLACADEPAHPHERRAARAVRTHARGRCRGARTSIGNSAGTLHRCRASRRSRAARHRAVRRQPVQRSAEPNGGRRDADGADSSTPRDRRARSPSVTALPTSRIRRRVSPSSASATPTAIRATSATPARRPSTAGAFPSSGGCRWT